MSNDPTPQPQPDPNEPDPNDEDEPSVSARLNADFQQAPVVREVDGQLVIDWPDPRPAIFGISAEAFEALIDRANRK